MSTDLQLGNWAQNSTGTYTLDFNAAGSQGLKNEGLLECMVLSTEVYQGRNWKNVTWLGEQKNTVTYEFTMGSNQF